MAGVSTLSIIDLHQLTPQYGQIASGIYKQVFTLIPWSSV